MQGKRHSNMRSNVLYSEDSEPGPKNATEPVPPDTTVTIPSYDLTPHETRRERVMRVAGNILAMIIRKVNQLLSFALGLLSLFLFIRFLLVFFGLTSSLFVHWIFALCAPFLVPFNNFIPALHYSGHRIDLSTLAAIVAYALAVTIVRRFFRVLVARPE
jgi:uncharacterized protein YggT (Ycf19 family)